ncbi:mannose-6-phosphate isomerase, class I [Streptomyces sp. NPDC005840]|uniref:mannose-6-phosphate isomerase n=1 Tax=Streptomyces doudnae TaxID=3075536 RepID=A0ABD5EVF5_9ACTN|nr:MULTISPECIES: mannose-6-phosphate isomerase, class I [unclassified Streptomyces]MDT0437840.1 mannose-6-phosphate isomerase, class I [Streptomyces sp. DSM 41981]MYQ63852.1 mannose-6-phosphate isomerase, class I [Streptomyces sp. SID4950]SCD67108.1 mannose-6-phosphate isomerase, type 1 [Streptomyces sp. SolWspMP-5a-2]
MDRLDNTVRPYAWGSTTALPALLGTEPSGEPQAEMWMGAHPGAPSRTGRGTLVEVIDADPERELGPAAAKFGPRLPFLLKLLAAGAPLSLQVHPDLEQARAGYADEERRGIPADAPHRNYKDANHKPELICALTEFDGLCGFRDPAATADLLAGLGVDSLKPYVDLLRAHPEDAALREVLTAVLTADPDEMRRTVTETAAACARLGGDYAPYADIAHHYPGDPGVIAALLLNHVRLQPGEALFLGAGIPHAYLNGLGVEIMANSDNVLRCGLTPKHVDVPELLRVVRFEAGDAGVLRPEATPDGEEVYATPIDEFRLSRFVLPEGAAAHDLTLGTPQILLCTGGTVRAGEHELTPGQSVFVPAGERAEVSGAGTVFRATVVV